jgi:hypothetical protein
MNPSTIVDFIYDIGDKEMGMRWRRFKIYDYFPKRWKMKIRDGYDPDVKKREESPWVDTIIIDIDITGQNCIVTCDTDYDEKERVYKVKTETLGFTMMCLNETLCLEDSVSTDVEDDVETDISKMSVNITTFGSKRFQIPLKLLQEQNIKLPNNFNQTY